ncbi:unnamed protein product [Rhizophagus irregularis]|nr:unnamed protein product [Rhizophagus irregularis]
MEILKFARPKLSVDTIEDFKDELYAILQRYNDKVNVHANARKKVKKLLDNFNSSFSSVEMRKFVYELEYHEEVRVNVTSAYTVELLKDQRENQERINQGTRCKRQCRQEHILEYLADVAYEEAESSSGKQTRQGNDFASESELLQDHYENNSNELFGQSDLRNSQEESVEYDVEAIRNLLNESETYSQEMNKISSSFRTYQHETRNILSENGIMDLSPTSEFVLLYTEETDNDKLIKEVFESIDNIFPEKAHEFLTNFFLEKLNED